jgi:WhiB family redox-sensing transcriptional regulator
MLATEVLQELLEEVGTVPDWADARCRDESVASVGLFFSDEIPEIARAKAICAGCAHQEECLEGALARREPWGVWGGQLFANGHILAQKRKRGRPRKNPPADQALSA